MDPQATMKLVFGLVGGLGIFLLGMKNMSEGMQAVAGDGLRKIIGAVTNNRFFAVGVGVLVTGTVQSSSVTTVMVIGFVNAGMMELSQAIGVIMGANIGTTITGWILVLKVGKYGLPLLGVFAFVYLFSKGDRLRYLAMAIMGVGMVFFGLEIMKDACKVINGLPAFKQWFQEFLAATYLGMLKCMLAGCLLTMMVQSSSATLGITISLAVTGVIPYETAAALVLGENIGTTVTALLASINANTNARRAAYFHVAFNIIGVLWISCIFDWYVDFIPWLINVDVTATKLVDGKTVFIHVAAAIAATHTVFNVTNTLVFLPLAGLWASVLERCVPDKALKEQPHLTSLDIRMLETPAIAIGQSRNEVIKMGTSCRKMMDWLKELLAAEEHDPELSRKLMHREEVLDTMQDEVVGFMTDLLAGNVPHSVVEEGRTQLRMADEYESISDYITSIFKFDRKLRKQGFRFGPKDSERLVSLHESLVEYLKLVTEGYEHNHPDIITRAHSMGAEIRHQVKTLRKQHMDELTVEKVSPNVNVAFTATLNSYRRVYDHALNVAEAVAGEK
jgi:phosphate:Na+ symporter